MANFIRTHKLVGVVLLVVVLTASAQISSAQSSHHYDPEQQDGIPVFSARTISRPTRGGSDADDWSSDRRPIVAQRRQSDADLDDGMEEDDDDEYKSGSNPQESVDNPSYGESGRAARDGDEIEDFFDKHLGPPQEATAPDESAPGVSYHREVAAVDPDDGDHFEAAASSPLAAIFHSLLSHDHKHKRPFLQIGTTGEEEPAADEASKESKKEPASSLKTSQSAQSFVETAPIALAITPLASMDSSAGPADAQPDEPSAPVREIYIGRRPTVMSYLQQAHGAPAAGYATAGSSHVWRANGNRQQMVTYDQEQQQQGDYARYPIAASYAHQQQAPSSAAVGGDDEQTVTYGLSFGGGGVGGGSGVSAEEQPASGEQVDEQSAGSADGEQQQQSGYVPYNTRYTTSSTRAHNNYYDNHTPSQYFRDRRPDYYQAQRLNQQQQQQMMYAPQQVYQQRYRPTGGSSSTRYHRDPSESAAAGQARPQQYVAQYYRVTNEPQQAQDDGQQPATREHSDEDFASSNPRRAQQLERQRLLAKLNREIKASPIYQQRLAAAGVAETEAGSAPRAQMFATAEAARPRHQLVAIRTVKKTFKGDDLDSYNSFHSEVDPYKSFTSTATMINDPTQSAHYNQLPQRASYQNDRHSAQRPSDVHMDQSQNQTGFWSAPHAGTPPPQHENPQLATGPLINYDASKQNQKELLRNDDNNNQANPQVVTSSVPTMSGESVSQDQGVPNLRVRREDADEREIDNDNDDDGVWVDDDDDDDNNRQQSSDVNETSQEPGGEEVEGDDGGEGSREDVATNNVPVGSAAPLMNPPGVIGGPHGYELSPNDLMVYHG